MSSPAIPKAVDWALALVAASLWLLFVRAGPLSLPYFWDEADVYVPGSLWVAQHGLNVTPGIFPDDYSRGHPPLLFLLAGIAFRLFGPAPLVGHLVVLPFSVLALAGTYLLGVVTFGRLAGLAAALLLAATPLFLSIGGMLLPEVPLVALTVLAFFAFARGRLLPAVLFASALVLIKETGVFTAGAMLGAVLWDGWRRRALSSRETLGRAALMSLPILVLCAFFLWQRLSPAGYFVFPHHGNLLWDRPFGFRDLATVWPSLLFWQGRWLVTLAVPLWLGTFLVLRRMKSPEEASSTEQWLPGTATMSIAMTLLVLQNAIFFAKMFWLERYALPAHPCVLLLLCGALFGGLVQGLHWRWRALPWAAVAACCGLGLAAVRAPTQPNEEELTFAYADVIETHRSALQAIERGGEEDPLVLTSWPMTIEGRHPYLGYVERAQRTVHIDSLDDEVPPSFDFVLLARSSRHALLLEERARRLGMREIGEFQVGVAPSLSLWAR